MVFQKSTFIFIIVSFFISYIITKIIILKFRKELKCSDMQLYMKIFPFHYKPFGGDERAWLYIVATDFSNYKNLQGLKYFAVIFGILTILFGLLIIIPGLIYRMFIQ